MREQAEGIGMLKLREGFQHPTAGQLQQTAVLKPHLQDVDDDVVIRVRVQALGYWDAEG